MKKLATVMLTLITAYAAIAALPAAAAQRRAQQSSYGHPPARWAQNQAELQAIRSWDLQGGMAVQTQSRGSNSSFNWQQQGRYFQISLFGPMGSGRVQLAGRPGQVTLRSSRQYLVSTTPEALIQKTTGWNIPISSLYYWIRGLPVAGSTHAPRAFDKAGHLVALRQNGWNIRYLSYTPVSGVELPNNMLLTSGQAQVRIAINNWMIRR